MAKVVNVTDGDTIKVLSPENEQVKIRLYGIDTPEKAQDFGKRAKQFTSGLCYGKNVDVKKHDTDRYGRIVGTVYCGDVNINEEIIKNGYAWVYQRYCKKPFCDQWLALEKQAKAQKTGLWSHKNPIPPWDYRKGKTSASKSNSLPGVYHGNVKSMVFHQSSCKHFNCKNCTAVFDIRQRAIESGYRPCGNCKP